MNEEHQPDTNADALPQPDTSTDASPTLHAERPFRIDLTSLITSETIMTSPDWPDEARRDPSLQAHRRLTPLTAPITSETIMMSPDWPDEARRDPSLQVNGRFTRWNPPFDILQPLPVDITYPPLSPEQLDQADTVKAHFEGDSDTTFLWLPHYDRYRSLHCGGLDHDSFYVCGRWVT